MSLTVKTERAQRESGGAATAVKYCLLDRDFCIISSNVSAENAENGVTGASFFDAFPAKRAVREEIAAYVRSYPQEVLLTLCGRVPVLIVGTLLAHTGLILAVLPQGAVKATFAFPAVFHGVPSCVCVSPSAQMRYKAHGDADFAEACRWLVGVSGLFVSFGDPDRPLAGVLSSVTDRLSALLDVPLFCDLAGISTAPCAKVDLPFATGVMLAALTAAKRADAVEGVRVYAAMEGTPTLYLEYTCRENADTVCEFLPLLSCAAARGVSLDVVSPVSDPCRVQIRACLGIVELSAQGVRERHRFLEGKSPLVTLPPAASAIPFSEISFD